MDGISAFQSLLNPVKEARLDMAKDGKSGKIHCRNRWSTSTFYNKEIALYLLGYLYGENIINDVELENLKNQIQNSSLPDR